jgi:xylulokinase
VTVLTVDLGTSATKVALWSEHDVVALARSTIATHHPHPGWAEQHADDWWESMCAACSDVRGAAPGAWGAVDTIGFAAARETFVLTDEELRPLGPGILWSDGRAADQVAGLGDAKTFRAATGVMATAGSHAAKLAWFVDNDPELLGSVRWILAPRDWVIARLTGVVLTDQTLASRTGLCAMGGWWLPHAVQRYRERLPEVVPATHVVGAVLPDVARSL